MKANLLSRYASSTVPFLVPLLAATACATAKPAERSPSTATNASTSSNLPAPPPTTGTIAVSADIRTACGISDQDAYFPFDSAALENKDVGPLDAIAKCFTVGPLRGRSMRLVGHADPRGSSEYNLVLGQRRADSVEGYLDHHGLTRSHVETTSRGAMDATGSDEAGWTRDRRVDVMLGSG
ncbi:MAG: OmpA family protein [Polyangiaceae bacterium]|jgi:peptidoglycan-associated lipoprotein